MKIEKINLIMNLKKFKINIFFFILLFLVFANKFDFFLNTYIILKNNAHSRLIDNYGYCNPQAYGFIKDVYNKYNLNKYNIKTSNKNILPTSEIFSHSYKNSKSSYEILINFNKEDIKKINNKFKVIENKQNCYLIEYLND